MRTIKKIVISILGYLIIIGGMILGVKFSTNATWGNVIKSEFWRILFIVSVGVITEIILAKIKDD